MRRHVSSGGGWEADQRLLTRRLCQLLPGSARGTMERQELLELLSQPEHQSEVCGLLSGSPEVVRIAVPCSMLSKGVSGAGSRVLVKATRAKGPLLAVDAGQWWRGAPNSPVWLDYRQVRAAGPPPLSLGREAGRRKALVGSMRQPTVHTLCPVQCSS